MEKITNLKILTYKEDFFKMYNLLMEADKSDMEFGDALVKYSGTFVENPLWKTIYHMFKMITHDDDLGWWFDEGQKGKPVAYNGVEYYVNTPEEAWRYVVALNS